jgi:chlorobactene glucosyltransferase
VTFAAALLALYWLSLLARALFRPEPLPGLPPAAGTAGPEASIVLAVRNEMDRILEPSIQSMLAQQYSDFEVLAVDDHSEDGSRNLLRAMERRNPRLWVCEAAEGAMGKRAALAQGAREARGDWLLFTDADVLLETDALARGIDFALGEEIDALSLLPKTVAISFWEQAALAATAWVVYQGRTLSRCNEDGAPVGLAAAGPYLLIRRAAFDRVGGYDRIPQNVLLDVALARRLREAGFRYRYLASRGAVEARMYRSLGEIWRGFGKNAFLALGGRLSTVLVAVPLYLFVVAAPLPLGLSLAFTGRAWGAALSLVAVAAMASVQNRAARFMGTQLKPLSILLSPLGGLLWAAIFFHSAASTLSSRGVFWKGRHLPAVDP